MVHMPQEEMWTFNSIASSGKRVRRLGINFGAPGDRRADDGTLWLEFPSVGGPSPDVPVLISGNPQHVFAGEDLATATSPQDEVPLDYFRQHASVVATGEPRWVFASGVRGARKLRIRLASREEAGASTVDYVVRVYLRTSSREPSGTELLGDDELQLKLQGATVERWSSGETAALFSQGAIREYSPVAVGEFLDVEFAAGGDARALQLPDVCGLEVFLASP